VRSVDDEAETAAAEVRARGRKSAILACDLRKESTTVALVGEAEAELGPVTLPGEQRQRLRRGRLLRHEPRLLGRAHGDQPARAAGAGPGLRRRLAGRPRGLIVNILDQRVLAPTPEFFSYSLSKTALWDATKILAQALAPRVRVNGIGPGPTLRSTYQDQAAFDARRPPL
jgi:NAD(P)-dependent dehydrogenase (short-subunit alcohol dehydrogenase family)